MEGVTSFDMAKCNSSSFHSICQSPGVPRVAPSDLYYCMILCLSEVQGQTDLSWMYTLLKVPRILINDILYQ